MEVNIPHGRRPARGLIYALSTIIFALAVPSQHADGIKG